MHITSPVDTHDGFNEATFRLHHRRLTLRYPHDYTEPHHGCYPRGVHSAFGCAMMYANRILVLDEDVRLPMYWTQRLTDETLCN